ncbi:glycosyltransferase family 39 protein [Bacillus pseudomycoides]|uniref:ArnT family glycosyltransferase n=1 Tax=Bacillus pseudomycoides TaxID=64104 RepID=UPI001FB3C145|nr:glycosyltransferase family 39 protein [Bacillus pseudomycoides]
MPNLSFDKINSFLIKALLLLCLTIFAFITWDSYLTIKEYLQIRTLISAPTIMVIALLFFVVAYTINKYMSRVVFIILLTLLAFSIRLIWIIKIPTAPLTDFALIYNGAVQAAHGDFSFTSTGYFTSWVYQLGFTMYEAFIIKIFGEGTFIIKLLNILYCTGTTLLVYQITSKVFNEWSGRIAGLIYAVHIPNIMMSSVLTNQHLATFFFYLGFYLLITKGLSSKYMWIFIGITLSLGDIIRPLGMLILIAVAIYIFLQGMIGRPKKTIINSIKKLCGIFAVFYLVHYIISFALISTGVTQYPLSNRDPLWKFVVGLNHETSGGYSVADAEYIMSLEIGEERTSEEKRIIKERLSDPEKVLSLFRDKFALMWGGIDSAPLWSLTMEPTDNINNLKDTATKYERYMYTATMLFGIVSLLYLIATKQKNIHYTLFLLLIIGYVTVHFLIEYQTRYRYFIIPSFTIIQSYGLYICYQLITKMKVPKQGHKVKP